MTDDDLSTQMMQLGVSRVGAALVLSVVGDIDLLTAPRLSETVKAALNDAAAGEPVVVDLSRATFLDSHGLAILDETSSAVAPRTGSPLRVVIGDARRVALPLQISGLDRRLSLYRTVENALADHRLI